MHIPRIFTDQTIAIGDCVCLSTVASHRIINVLRMTVGRQVVLFNGSGGEYEGRVTRVAKKTVSIEITHFHDTDRESLLRVELAICLIKKERMDWLLQKATELGVSRISLLISDYTDATIRADRIVKKLHHWRQIVISACEQSGRTGVPVLDPPLALDTWLATVTADRRYILHPHSCKDSHKESHKQWGDCRTPSSLALLVGPEGGFTQVELTSAVNKQFSPLILGPRILRAETAPLAALTIVQRQFGDL